MPDKDSGTPRVFLVRHGETEWTVSGRYTGISDIPLTENGEAQVRLSASTIAGPGKIIDPARLCHIFHPSTFVDKALSHFTVLLELLFHAMPEEDLKDRCEITEEIREWDYGRYDGLVTSQIQASRKERGLDTEKPWSIWIDGCEDGESPSEVTARLQRIISKIKEMQKPFMHGEKAADVVVVAHGHILRCFAKVWLGFPLAMNMRMMLEPGAVGILSYEHHNVNEPALLLGVNMAGREAGV